MRACHLLTLPKACCTWKEKPWAANTWDGWQCAATMAPAFSARQFTEAGGLHCNPTCSHHSNSFHHSLREGTRSQRQLRPRWARPSFGTGIASACSAASLQSLWSSIKTGLGGSRPSLGHCSLELQAHWQHPRQRSGPPVNWLLWKPHHYHCSLLITPPRADERSRRQTQFFHVCYTKYPLQKSNSIPVKYLIFLAEPTGCRIRLTLQMKLSGSARPKACLISFFWVRVTTFCTIRITTCKI